MSGSKKVTVGYRLLAGIHYILCKGPIDRIRKIRADKKPIWAGRGEGGPIVVSAENIFGGHPPEGEGGVLGTVDIEMGAPDQAPNSYLSSLLGDIPAFRGVVGAVLNQVYVSASRYIKPWEFLAQRIYVRQTEGIEQWYKSKAEVVVQDDFIGSQAIFFIIDKSTSMLETDGTGLSRFQAVQQALLGLLDLIDEARLKANVRVDVGISFYAPVTGTDELHKFNMSTADKNELKNFVSSQSADGATKPAVGFASASEFFQIWSSGTPNVTKTCIHLTDGVPDEPPQETTDNAIAAGSFILNVANGVFVYGINLALEDTTYTIQLENTPNDGVPVIQNNPAQIISQMSGYIFKGYSDMNPAHIIRECLTDPDFGLAFSDSETDEDAFVYAADKLYEEGLGLSLIWDGQMQIDEFIQEIARHIDAAVDVNLETGAARIKLIRDDYDVDSGLVSIGPDEIDRVEDFNQAAWGEQANSVTVVYEDGPTGEKATVTVSDTAAVQRQGKVVATTVQYPAVSNRAVAARLAARDLRALKARVRSCTVYCTRVAAGLRMGDVFLLTWPELGYNNAITRVERIDLGDPRSGMVRISAVDDVFALSSVSPVASAPPDWTNPVGEALPTPEHLAVEMPYFEAVQRFGQTTVDASLTDNVFLGYLIAAGTRPTGVAHINATLSVDAGAGYEDSEFVDFSPLAYLAGDISFTDTVFPVSNEVDIDLVTVGTFAQIADEILVVESIDSDSIVFGRGALDTIPAEYAGSGSLPIIFWDEYGGTDGTEYIDGQTVNVKLLTSTGSNQLSSASAPVDSVTFDQRAFRPYPPGNLKVNTEYFPETIGGTSELSLAWAHRDRTQQTSTTIIDFFDGDVGPEAGVTYTLRIYGETDALIRTETGIEANSYTYTSDDERNDSGLATDIPFWDDVASLLHFDGANGSTTFTDEKDLSWTANSSAALTTLDKVFGTAALRIPGAGSFIRQTTESIGTVDFTLQAWIKADNVANSFIIFDARVVNDDANGLIFYVGSTGRLTVGGGNPFNITQGSTTLSGGTWYKVRLTRDSGTVRVYLDDISTPELTRSHSADLSNASWRIGNSVDATSGGGYIDEFRLTKNQVLGNESGPFPDESSGALRLNGRLRFELESVREESTAEGGDITSMQHYDVEVRRPGWNFNWNMYWNGGV